MHPTNAPNTRQASHCLTGRPCVLLHRASISQSRVSSPTVCGSSRQWYIAEQATVCVVDRASDACTVRGPMPTVGPFPFLLLPLLLTLLLLQPWPTMQQQQATGGVAFPELDRAARLAYVERLGTRDRFLSFMGGSGWAGGMDRSAACMCLLRGSMCDQWTDGSSTTQHTTYTPTPQSQSPNTTQHNRADPLHQHPALLGQQHHRHAPRSVRFHFNVPCPQTDWSHSLIEYTNFTHTHAPWLGGFNINHDLAGVFHGPVDKMIVTQCREVCIQTRFCIVCMYIHMCMCTCKRLWPHPQGLAFN